MGAAGRTNALRPTLTDTRPHGLIADARFSVEHWSVNLASEHRMPIVVSRRSNHGDRWTAPSSNPPYRPVFRACLKSYRPPPFVQPLPTSAPFVRVSFGARSFSVVARRIWNGTLFPPDLRMCTSRDTFCRHYETHYLWSPYGIGQTIIFSCCGFYLSSIYLFFLACSQRSHIGCVPYLDTWCGPSANLECRSETCCARLAETQDAVSE